MFRARLGHDTRNRKKNLEGTIHGSRFAIYVLTEAGPTHVKVRLKKLYFFTVQSNASGQSHTYSDKYFSFNPNRASFPPLEQETSSSLEEDSNPQLISCTSIGIPSLWVGGPDGRYILKIYPVNLSNKLSYHVLYFSVFRIISHDKKNCVKNPILLRTLYLIRNIQKSSYCFKPLNICLF